MACLTNLINQTSLDICPPWIPLVNNEFSNPLGRRVWSDRIFMGIYMNLVRASILVPQLGLYIFTTWKSSNCSYALVFTDLVCWFGLLRLFSTSSSIFVSDLYMYYHNFYCIFSCYLSLTNPYLRYIYSFSHTGMVCSVGYSLPNI
jgi:hypothetical protein